MWSNKDLDRVNLQAQSVRVFEIGVLLDFSAQISKLPRCWLLSNFLHSVGYSELYVVVMKRKQKTRRRREVNACVER